MTTQILGKVAITPRGEYNSQTEYTKSDLVTYNGSSYVSLQSTQGNLPTNSTYWQLIASKGDTGVKGDTGEKGDTGNGILSIVKTSTSGLIDTYTVTFTDGTTTTFNVTNGEDGDDYILTSQDKTDIANIVLSELPTAESEAF